MMTNLNTRDNSEVPENDRKKFEQEYRYWIRLMSRDAAYRLSALQDQRKEDVLKAYNDFKNPLAVFRPISELDRVKRLAGEMLSDFIVIETDAITFFPSMYNSIPGALDFAVTMNRRLFYQGLWFPIIALNSEYIRKSSDRLLTYALLHEFEIDRIFQETSSRLRVPTSDEKKDITDSAKEISAKGLTINQEELIEDERLMLELSKTMPLLPKPYAEWAMLLYLEKYFYHLKSFGITSLNSDEEYFGEEQFMEFSGWSEFTQKTYEIFVREIISNLRDADQGYG